MFEYANRLQALGHEVTCVCPFEQFPCPDNAFRRLERWLREKLYYPLKLGKSKPAVSTVKWFPLKAKLIEVPDLSAKYVPNADIVIATAWETAEWVNTYPDSKGSKFYFIQHYEVWAGPKKRVDQTYKLPLKKITIASWLTKKMTEFNEPVCATITNGINLEHFYNENKKYNQPRRIGMLYHGTEWKGTKDGLQAFAQAKQKHPDIQLVLFGVQKEEAKVPIPNDAEFHLDPSQEELRQLYCSLDIFLSPSWTEGCQLPPMEAMACKAAVVATNVGGVPDYAIAGKTALLSEPHDPAGLARNLIELLDNKERLEQVSLAGYKHIKEFTWEKATQKLEQTLVTCAAGPAT